MFELSVQIKYAFDTNAEIIALTADELRPALIQQIDPYFSSDSGPLSPGFDERRLNNRGSLLIQHPPPIMCDDDITDPMFAENHNYINANHNHVTDTARLLSNMGGGGLVGAISPDESSSFGDYSQKYYTSPLALTSAQRLSWNSNTASNHTSALSSSPSPYVVFISFSRLNSARMAQGGRSVGVCDPYV